MDSFELSSRKNIFFKGLTILFLVFMARMIQLKILYH
jgi:hypothetical protein